MPVSAAPIEAVVIDLDGTLIDTAADFTVAINATFALRKLGPLTRAQVITCVGKGSEHLVRSALALALHIAPDEALVKDALADYMHIYGNLNGNHAEVYPGVAEGLEAMRAAGLRIACVTNKPAGFARPLLNKLGLGEYFEVVVGGDSLERRKPDPLPMLYTAERFGLEPAAVLAIGDSENDVQAARCAGIPVWLVPYGFNHVRPPESTGADAIVETLLQAATRLAALNSSA
ncbi:MAG: phosphoglycolate phosphatase [Candidatus Protistobacter heckmanni]|nr:phosphoglycolate phosphatase [Candidatus Protistobacter heckmanni]